MNRAHIATVAALLAVGVATVASAADAPMPHMPTQPAGGMAKHHQSAAAAPKAAHAAAHFAQRPVRRDRDTAALNLLSANGYTGLTDFRADGIVFVAKAQHDGKPVTVMVDPDTGVIAPIG